MPTNTCCLQVIFMESAGFLSLGWPHTYRKAPLPLPPGNSQLPRLPSPPQPALTETS